MRTLSLGITLTFIAFVFLTLSGCGGEGGVGEPVNEEAFPPEGAQEQADAGFSFPPQGLDTESIPAASFVATLGTGRETYMPLEDGDTLFLELGHQGLQHVLVSIQLLGLPQDRYTVDFLLEREDGVAISEPARVRLPFNTMENESGVELVGYTLVVADPALGVGYDGVLRIAVEGPEGDIAMDQREVYVEWAPEGWDPDL